MRYLSFPLFTPVSPCSTRRKWPVAVTVLLLAIVVCGPQSAIAQGDVAAGRIAGLTAKPVLDGTAKLVGPYAPQQMLRLVFGLVRPHAAEEEKFLEELQAYAVGAAGTILKQ